MQVNMEGIDVAALFAAGAYSSGLSRGMTVKQAQDFAYEICKEAASKKRPKWEDEEDDDTFWSRNKGWIIPALVGTGAFLFGSHAGQNKRPDRGHFENAWDFLKDRAGRLLGVSDDALRSSTVNAPKFKDEDAWRKN